MKTKFQKNKKKAALDIAKAVTAKLWYKVIKDVQRIKSYKCTLCLCCVGRNYGTVNQYNPPPPSGM